MRKSVPLFVGAIVLGLGISWSCQQAPPSASTGKAAYTASILPQKALSIKLPASLSPAASLSPSSTKAIDRPSCDDGSGYAPTAGGYRMIHSIVACMDAYVPRLEAYAIIADAVISQNDLAPSPTAYVNESVTFTESMYLAIAALLPSWELPPSSFIIGKKIVIPSLLYSVDGAEPLVNSMTLAIDSCRTLTYAWSADGTKLKMSCADSSSDDYAGGLSFAVATDTSTSSTALQIKNSMQDVLNMAVQKDPSSSLDGFFALASLSYSNYFAFSLWGYCDAQGGLVTTERTKSLGTAATQLARYIEEGFSGNGSLLYAAISSDGATWTVCPGFDDATPVSDYGTDMGAALLRASYSAEALL